MALIATVTDPSTVSDLDRVELLATRLPALVGSPLWINEHREDLQVAHATVARWVEILERLCSVLRIPPVGAHARRSCC